MARRGDRIGCTVLFKERRAEDGKIPVFFTLNGSEIILEGGESPGKSRIYMDFEKSLFPFIGMTVGSRVLAKVRSTLTAVKLSDNYASRSPLVEVTMSSLFFVLKCHTMYSCMVGATIIKYCIRL